MKQYTVKMRLTIVTHALVEAESVEDAIRKADLLEVEDDGRDTGECVDWEVIADPKESP